MGNQLAAPAKQGVETQGELLNVVVKETLGGGRFLKTLLCLHDNGGLVVVKVFYKRKDATSLAPYKQQLQAIRDALLGLSCPHVWPMQLWWETPNAGYMMRQHFFANLYDRLSTRPFLTAIEKRWITFQLLHGLSQAHAHGVCHGDIKCENVAVTSWHWVFLADFAPYKPTYLPADNPADFSYYFDTGSRRRCYLAPERFFEGSAAAINTAAPLQPDMDVFSLGCVIAELWLDGRPLFDLSRLLAFRRGEYDPAPSLAGVAPDIAELVVHMTQRAPGERWSADHYLTSWPRRIFPAHFSEVLHPLFNSLLGLEPDARLAAVAAQYGAVEAAVAGGGEQEGGEQQQQQAAAAAAGGSAGGGGEPTRRGAGGAGAAAPAGGAGSELLAEVTSLLEDVGAAQRRLGGPGGAAPAAAEDDGICIDELPPHDGGLLGGPPSAEAGPSAAAGERQVVAVEWYEHQVRDASNQWLPGSPAETSGSRRQQAPSRDGMQPPGGFSQWAGDWQVQPGSHTAADGWQYCAAAPDSAGGEPGGDNAPSWGAACSEQTLRRRRRWTRLCSRPGDTPGSALQGPSAAAADGGGGGDQGMVLLAVLLCTLLRGSKLPESKRAAIALLLRSALLCEDEVRLQTVVPYLLTQLADPSAGVRTLALRCVVRLMASLSRLPPADARVYPDYLLPSLSLLPNDPEEVVRVAYALAVAHLAAAAHEHLLGMQFGGAAGGGEVAAAAVGGTAKAAAEEGQAREGQADQEAAHGGGGGGGGGGAAAAVPDTDEAGSAAAEQAAPDAGAATAQAGQQAGAGAASTATPGPPPPPPVRYDAEVAAVRVAVEKVVLELVTGTRSSADIKRALLSHAHQLGLFFGRRDINDLLLPLLITCLNAAEWQLRGSFFGAIAAVGPHTGRDSLDVFLLPCLEQALVDSETAVVCDAVRCLAAVCGHLRKRSLLAAAGKVAPLLQHRSAAVRHSAVAFVVAAARALPPADVFAQLTPMAAGFLQHRPLLLTDEEHLAAHLSPSAGGGGEAACRRNSSSRRQRPQQQQQPSSPTRQQSGAEAGGSRRGTGDQPSLAAGQGAEHGAMGALLSRPESVRRTSSLPRAGSLQPGGSGAAGPDLNLEGSELLLRPACTVYCLEVDPDTQGQEGRAGGTGGGAAAAAAPEGAGGGAYGGGQRGYRPEGFSDSGAAAATAGDRGPAAALPQNAAVVPSLLVPPPEGASPAGAAVATAAPGAAAPGEFWPGLAAGPPAAAAGSGLLTGLHSSLGVGPGGLAVGPTATGKAAGLRPRPKSSHTVAVENIARRKAVLQERYNALAEALARDPGALEAGERQQLERLGATLHRLNLQPGCDVRCPAALLTHKMAAITSRAGPAGAVPGSAGDPSAPAVFDAVSAAVSTGIGQHLPGPGGDGLRGGGGGASGGPSWRPRGVLASHLQEHRAAVTCLATTANGALLLSGSEDETIKVWDVRRLERDVSFASRLTYACQSGRITSLCGTMDGASVASASASGSLHVWRVEYTCRPGSWAPDKYRGITAVRQLSPGEGAIMQVVPWGGHPALLLYATQRGGVHCCDLRCAADVWHVPSAPSLGLCQQLVPDPSGQHWLAQGTSRGWVCLWDVRFLLAVNSWQHPQRCGINAMSLAVAAPPRLGLQPGSLGRAGVPLLYIAAGLQEVGLWDVLDGRCHQVLRVLDRQESQLPVLEPPAALQPPLPAGGVGGASAGAGSGGAAGSLVHHNSINVNQLAGELSGHLAIDQINSPQARLGGVTSLLPLPGGGLLAGGADRCVRYWDASWPERSYIVAGPVWPDDTGIIDPNSNKLQVPSHVYRYSRRLVGGVPVLEERCVGDARRLVTPDSSPDLGSKLRMHDLVHADGITHLLTVEGTSKLLVSASRDGCVKVWK